MTNSSNYNKMSKAKLIGLIKDYKRREMEYLEGEEKNYYKYLIDRFNKKHDELEIKNELLIDAQIQLELSREKYVDLYDNAPVGYLTLDNAGLIEDINHTGIVFLGLELKLLKGFPFNIYIDKEYSNKFFHLLNQCRSTLLSMDVRCKLKNGRYVQIVTTPHQIEEKTSFKIILYDITEIKVVEEKLNKSLGEKELLLKEIHHRIKNNLQIISSLLNLQRYHMTDKAMQEVFKESQNRIRSMAMVHERLYLSDDIAMINLREYLAELSRFLYMSYPFEDKLIRLSMEVVDTLLEIDIAIDIGLIFNELMTNSLKYAFNKSPNGQISITVFELDDKLDICFADNGDGIPEDRRDSTDSLGLTIVRSLIEKHMGTIHINHNKGTEFLLTIPKKRVS